MSRINNLGTFDSLAAVWKVYPYGGKEGDFVIVEGKEIEWNKYTNSWGDSTGEDVKPELSKTFNGDVIVRKNLHVGGMLFASNVRTPDKGLFASAEALKKAVSIPEVGFWAAVGDSFPATLWVCTEEGKWENTGTTYNGGEVILDDYVRKNAIADNLFVKVESEAVLRQMLEEGNYDASKVYYTEEEE